MGARHDRHRHVSVAGNLPVVLFCLDWGLKLD
ncbi:hypothetical protein LINGRAHAP2_LOCUS35351 [Linum grandiflorum]